jgi:hypothetical protein
MNSIEKKEYDRQYNLDNKKKKRKIQRNQYYLNHKNSVLEYSSQYYTDHKNKIINQNKQYYLNNKEKIHKRHKKHYLNNQDKIKESFIQRRYKLTKEQYIELLAKQNNKCAICNNTFTKTPFVDHDHITGVVRGLLCNKHNSLLGFANDNIEILNNAIKYLQLHLK